MHIDKPPMGWNSWNTFADKIDEKLIRDTADAIVKLGLKDLGYEYVIIDDIWSLKTRDKNGRLVADPQKFPSGMKALADYIHGRGLKFGMYSCAGVLTCAGFPSGHEHEFTDAQTFAEWGVDYLKYDYCNKPKHCVGELLYRRMGIALANCGRDIVFAACSWGADNTHEWIRATGANTWRSTGDIFDNFESVKDIIKKQYKILAYGGKNCFNDMDMLIVGMHGNGNVGIKGCTFEEYRTHFSAWALLGSPLIIGCDIRNTDEETLRILSNRELIKINQDQGGGQAFAVDNDGDEDKPILARMLDNGDIAVGMFNLTDGDASMTLFMDNLALPHSCGKTLAFTDVWTGEEITPDNACLCLTVKPHDCKVLRGRLTDIK